MMLIMMTMSFATQFKVNEVLNFYLLSMFKRTLDDKPRKILAARENSISLIVTNTLRPLTVYQI